MNGHLFVHCTRLHHLRRAYAEALVESYGLHLKQVADHEDIPGSYWGGAEAGLLGHTVLVRCDTPVHSLLHEFAHAICMDSERRRSLHTDAGGTDIEECAVCYLQILLADELPGVGKERMMRDMDAWGYSFRLGRARQWFRQDAREARQWLTRYRLIDAGGHPIRRLRA